MTDLVDSLLGNLILDAITPAVNSVIGSFVPAQTELAALVDLPALALTGLAASNGSTVETRVVPGGYAQLNNGGMSLASSPVSTPTSTPRPAPSASCPSPTPAWQD